MRKLPLFFSLFIVFGCQPGADKKNQAIEIKNNTFKNILDKFTGILSKDQNPDKIVTINFEINKDTVSVQLINSYPDLDLTEVKAVTDYDGFRLCFVGVYPVNGFYETSPLKDLPKDIIRANDEYKKGKDIRITEPLFWKLYFVNDTMVDYYPRDAISKLVSN
jgi:hypothetical protein